MIINDSLINDDNIISTSFCDYFTNIGPNLAESIENSNISYDNYIRMKPPNINSIFLTPCTEDELIKLMQNMKPKNSSGLDNLNNKFSFT